MLTSPTVCWQAFDGQDQPQVDTTVRMLWYYASERICHVLAQTFMMAFSGVIREIYLKNVLLDMMHKRFKPLYILTCYSDRNEPYERCKIRLV